MKYLVSEDTRVKVYNNSGNYKRLLPQFPTVLERCSTTLYFPVPAPPSSKMAAMGQR